MFDDVRSPPTDCRKAVPAVSVGARGGAARAFGANARVGVSGAFAADATLAAGTGVAVGRGSAIAAALSVTGSATAPAPGGATTFDLARALLLACALRAPRAVPTTAMRPAPRSRSRSRCRRPPTPAIRAVVNRPGQRASDAAAPRWRCRRGSLLVLAPAAGRRSGRRRPAPPSGAIVVALRRSGISARPSRTARSCSPLCGRWFGRIASIHDIASRKRGDTPAMTRLSIAPPSSCTARAGAGAGDTPKRR